MSSRKPSRLRTKSILFPLRKTGRSGAWIAGAILVPCLILLASCQTVPKTIPTSLTEAEYFQKAQNAASGGDYAAALKYYNTYIERYPKSADRVAEANYEIAFIYYKEGKMQKAHDLFGRLIGDYKKPGADSLPRWPLVLSNKLLVQVNKDMKK